MAKVIYIWLIRIVSWCAHFRRTTTVIYLMSFGDNLDFIRQLNKRVPSRLTVYYLPAAQRAAEELATTGVTVRPFHDSLALVFRLVPVITRAADVYVDNYYAFTAGLYRHPQQRVIQVWHASGAVKAFGWDDPQTAKRSPQAQRRFQAVYNHITDYVVASDKMGAVFANSYHVPMTRMRVLGYPRSDRYRHPDWVDRTRAAIYARYPQFKDHDVILYAPTYRAGVQFELPTDFDQLRLNQHQLLVVKLHPHLAAQADVLVQRYPQNVMTVPEFSSDDLLTVASTLVSDYSSVIFDYALLPNCKKMVFYDFDRAEFSRTVGLQPDLTSWLPGPRVTTVAELSAALAAPVTQQPLLSFNQLWNTRNDGHATERTLTYFYPK